MRAAINYASNIVAGNVHEKVRKGNVCNASTCEYENDYLVPFSVNDGSVTSTRGHKDPTTANLWSVYPGPAEDPQKFNLLSGAADQSTFSWAQFAVVPLPAAAALFLSGILALGFAVRSRIGA